MPFTLGQRPALDGLRGCAIALVVALHFGVVSGGFIGVEVFFVLSGFLITALLLEEARTTGTVRIGQFYARRALRLFPALFVLLVALTAFVAVNPNGWASEDFPRDAAATIGYVANWVFASVGNEPNLLTHAWSLAVEEQFYLVWPLALAALVARRASYRTLLAVCVTGVAASAAARYLLFAARGVDRAYFGTDARVGGLLVGCAIAVASYAGWLPRGRAAPIAVRAVASVSCLGISAVAFGVERHQSGLYTVGFTAVSLAAAALIVEVIVSPEGLIARGLSWSPLAALGRISYGVYLWHWPAPFVIRSIAPEAPHSVRVALSLLASVVTALWSYHYVEQPCRRLRYRFRAVGPLPSVAAEA